MDSSLLALKPFSKNEPEQFAQTISKSVKSFFAVCRIIKMVIFVSGYSINDAHIFTKNRFYLFAFSGNVLIGTGTGKTYSSSGGYQLYTSHTDHYTIYNK